AVACLRCDVSADGRNLALNMAASHFGGKLQAEAYDQAQDLERKTGTAVKYRAIITQNQDGTNGTQDSL
ncbi:MAG: hypothetical protein GY849_16525, partial [Deltaproteobacteria bacterium]|nr:hypothetical protein [Deltaproteobacteria bacterium]